MKLRTFLGAAAVLALTGASASAADKDAAGTRWETSSRACHRSRGPPG